MGRSFQPVGTWMGTDLGAEGCCRSLNALLYIYLYIYYGIFVPVFIIQGFYVDEILLHLYTCIHNMTCKLVSN